MSLDKILVVDAGNTALKYAVIQDSTILNTDRLAKDNFPALQTIYSEFNCTHVAIVSVRSAKTTNSLVEMFGVNRVFLLSDTIFNGFRINYNQPESLGKDRLCNAVASHFLSKTDYSVSIDIGTCIKFDLVHKSQGYLGGSISPGINLRYQALHTFTDNLPLITVKKRNALVGTSTAESISSGVLNGIETEINGLIRKYEEHYQPLTIFVTGGDHRYFDLVAKNDIFAHENLTLIGLYQIYIQNV
jgi:type III pantothenate kinase